MPRTQRSLFDDLIVDSFAGGGGASVALERAAGRPVDVAINHDPEAIAMHARNHPHTRHLCESIWDIDPIQATRGRPVGVMWASPDCRHHSRAKGGKPVEKKIRGLAWVVIRWAAKVRPRVIFVENVEEFETWGPLRDGRPCPLRKGSTFRAWTEQLRSLGYEVEWRSLRACDFGAPTSRKRLYLIARRDGESIRWPEPTHGPGRKKPWRTAAECIEWSVPCPSIFERERPLAEATLRRIAAGVVRYVIDAERPFVVRVDGQGDAGATLIQTSWGERKGQAPRVPGLHKPLGTVVAGGAKHALVAAFLARHFKGMVGIEADRPLPTVTAKDHHSLVTTPLSAGAGTGGADHAPEVRAFLTAYYGTGTGQSLHDPMRTATARDRFGLVTVDGVEHVITDLGMRMLVPRELFRAQGFPDEYEIDAGPDGKRLTKTAQTRMAGNSVSPPVAAAIIAANLADTASGRVA